MHKLKKHHVTCSCSSCEHTIRYTCDPEEAEVYIEVYLNQYRNSLKRIIVAIKYIFGYKSRYGHWDTTLMDKEEIEALRNFLNQSLEDIKAKENHSENISQFNEED
jgi:predicted RNA-binding protein with PIN domain